MNTTVQWLLAGVLGLAALLVLAGLAYTLLRAKRCPACPVSPVDTTRPVADGGGYGGWLKRHRELNPHVYQPQPISGPAEPLIDFLEGFRRLNPHVFS